MTRESERSAINIGTGATRRIEKASQSAEIERQIQEFLARGGEIDRAQLRETKHVDLTWRHYTNAAMEGVDGEEV